ncbi:META domain-containing protein [Deinococcus sp. QL22]|uniref:META domain-containing protein n=1 Tax=Deinococcus sp. QL22 TaxID=2939437 RepID=UPI0020178436|nr:META domain-containing protein [Deinococcus sp. QL22]UQN06709.1 META domain-containing protein [Deinococcus sp. QL22]
MRSLFALTAAALTVALSAPASAQTSPFVGTNWTLTGLTENGKLVSPGQAAPRPTLSLSGTAASGSTSCNTYRANFATRGDILRFTVLSTTRRACPDRIDGLEERFVNLMRGVSRFAVQGKTLTLFSGKTDQLVFTSSQTMTPPIVSSGGKGQGMTTLEGNWFVTRLVAGGRQVALPAQASFTFAPDATGFALSGTAGCNRAVGRVTTSGTAVTFGPLATTRMMCDAPRMAQERALLQALSGTLSAKFSSSSLVLSGPTGTVTLSRTAGAATGLPSQPVAATPYTLRQVNGQAAPTTPKPVTLRLEGGRVGGSDGCNSYGGSYRMEGNQLVLTSPLTSTMMACMDAESTPLLSVLDSRPTLTVQGQTLTLNTADVTLTFGR